MNPKLGKFPPFPPRQEWDSTACPQDERFTCLVYTCYALAQKLDPSFTDRLPKDWKTKYPRWPVTPYLQIPEEARREVQPDLHNKTKVMAKGIIARSIPPETFKSLELLNATGNPIIHTRDGKTFVLLDVSHGMSPEHLAKHLGALAREYLDPKLLGVRPEGAGSYARQFQSDLNALTAYMLLQTLSPAEASVVSAELPSIRTKGKSRRKRGLYSTVQKWLEARERGEFLIKKTLEGRLLAVLLLERLESQSWCRTSY
jgi:hypothetical protein